MTDAVFVEPGEQIVAEFTNLGSVTVAAANKTAGQHSGHRR
jgi:hypothetical protein